MTILRLTPPLCTSGHSPQAGRRCLCAQV